MGSSGSLISEIPLPLIFHIHLFLEMEEASIFPGWTPRNSEAQSSQKKMRASFSIRPIPKQYIWCHRKASSQDPCHVTDSILRVCQLLDALVLLLTFPSLAPPGPPGAPPLAGLRKKDKRLDSSQPSFSRWFFLSLVLRQFSHSLSEWRKTSLLRRFPLFRFPNHCQRLDWPESPLPSALSLQQLICLVSTV